MGCDIHCYVEYRKRGAEKSDDKYDRQWRDFNPRMNPGRNYRLFGFMAGVRTDGPPVAEPRGFPDDAGTYANWDYWLHIDYRKEGSDDDMRKPLTDEALSELAITADNCEECGCYEAARVLRSKFTGHTPPEMAQQWVERDRCRYRNDRDGKPRWVSHPDWHTHSWLTAAEFKRAIELTGESNEWGCGPEYHALLAAMLHFESTGYETRLVFWFDN